jgi:hypothetical protein
MTTRGGEPPEGPSVIVLVVYVPRLAEAEDGRRLVRESLAPPPPGFVPCNCRDWCAISRAEPAVRRVWDPWRL